MICTASPPARHPRWHVWMRALVPRAAQIDSLGNARPELTATSSASTYCWRSSASRPVAAPWHRDRWVLSPSPRKACSAARLSSTGATEGADVRQRCSMKSARAMMQPCGRDALTWISNSKEWLELHAYPSGGWVVVTVTSGPEWAAERVGLGSSPDGCHGQAAGE